MAAGYIVAGSHLLAITKFYTKRHRANLWPMLFRYCDDHGTGIDDSAAERGLRGIAIGRRNYLFVGADCGGERVAAIYSLIGSAELNGVAPETRLRHILVQIADRPVNQVNDFLLWNYYQEINPA